MEEDTTNHAAVRFRPSKNRKAYRQRDADVDTTQNDEESPLTHIRATRKARPRGVAFGAPPPSDSQALVPAAEDRPAKGIPDRFMHQTGMVATLNDKHMNEYIESRLSSRAPGPSSPDASAARDTAETKAPTGLVAANEPTKHGKLVEVDVPLDTRTARKRKLDPEPARPKRGRNRRGSDDIKRDQLVEAFLHENRLDVYDFPVQSNPTTRGDDTSADDRMADEFRQRYLNEVAARRQKKRPVQTTKQQQQQAENVLKGPKLGGSRNQRAAARDMLLKQEKEKSARRF